VQALKFLVVVVVVVVDIQDPFSSHLLARIVTNLICRIIYKYIFHQKHCINSRRFDIK